jgi:hypothetical protein
MTNKFKRYTIWVNETMWRKVAIEAGLVYGVYDNKEDKKVHIEGITITSRQQALEEAEKLNSTIVNLFEY